MTNWTNESVNSTSYTINTTTITYDESGATYDTLATYYDGNEITGAQPSSYTQESTNATTWS